MGTPAALGRLTAPTSRLSQLKWSAGRVAKVQKVLLRIQSGDFCFHESHPGSVAKLT
jgi:predicted amino acid racemase